MCFVSRTAFVCILLFYLTLLRCVLCQEWFFFVCYFAFFGSVMVCFVVRMVLVCYFVLFLTLLGLFWG